jgi:hypothetical protein
VTGVEEECPASKSFGSNVPPFCIGAGENTRDNDIDLDVTGVWRAL